jgi:hypothetical protein
MPTGADILIDFNTSFLLVGDGGTHKTFFIGTCPQPSYTFDLDNGFAIHQGRADMDFDRYKELSFGQKLQPWHIEQGGWYEWGMAWPAIIAKLNEIGRAMDTGTNKYKTIGVDSLTLLVDCASTYIKKGNAKPDNPTGEFKDGRQFWGVFLNLMSELFGQFSAWPVMKVLTAHIKRDENLTLGTTEKLPLVSGQFAGKVGVYFDEVYYTEVKTETDTKVPGGKKETFTFRCHQDGIIKMAKSRKYNLPDMMPTDYQAIMAHINKTRLKVAK